MADNTSALPWAEWIIDRYIGKSEGSAYFQVHHEETGENASIERKDMYLPDDFEMDLRRKGGSVKEYSDLFLAIALKRIELAQQIGNIPGILGINDFKATPNVKAGYTLFLRRPYAVPLADYQAEHPMSLIECVQAVCELCDALEECHKLNIAYNGVRLDSIYVTEDKHFVLGTDYFLSLRNFDEKLERFYVENISDSAAPEAVNKGVCNAVSDVYTLGLLLYCMFNGGKIPFLPKKQTKAEHIYKGAVERRLRGEKLLNPVDGTDEMIAVIKKACEFDPEKRYASVAELKKELLYLLENDLVAEVVVNDNDDDDDDVDDEFATDDYKAEMAARAKKETIKEKDYLDTNDSYEEEEAENPDDRFRRKKYNKPRIVRIIALIALLAMAFIQIANSGIFRSRAVPQEEQTEVQTEAQTQAETEAESN